LPGLLSPFEQTQINTNAITELVSFDLCAGDHLRLSYESSLAGEVFRRTILRQFAGLAGFSLEKNTALGSAVSLQPILPVLYMILMQIAITRL
jgi:hypothetical protein